MTGSYKDTLRFFFTVTDVEGDTVFVGNSVGVRANGGSVEVSGIKFERNSNGVYVDGTVMFRIVPFDANRGVLSSVVFHRFQMYLLIVVFLMGIHRMGLTFTQAMGM